MRILSLHASYEGSGAPFASLDPECDPSRYAPEHTWTRLGLRKATVVPQLLEAARANFDLYVNLCDGAWEEDRAGIEVVHTLERLGVAFTGASSRFYDPSRIAMKMAAHSVGVEVPAFVVARSARDSELALERLRFPMLVKHPHGYSSVGLSAASCVRDGGALARQVTGVIARYGAALIEEFIAGRELTVLVAEPRASNQTPLSLAPVEFVFPPGETFKHFDLKWKNFDSMQTRLLDEPDLERRARAAAERIFEALEGSGYARCDFRVDEHGQLHFLEINPNCGVFYPDGQFGSADFILAHDPIGHRGFLNHLLDRAWERRARTTRAWEVQFSRARGFELTAARALEPGEIAVRYEERPQRLASRAYVERVWGGQRRAWFDRYAWPVSENVYALWSDDPEEWCPINHSCDPNTWLEGLDLTARRPIRAGEPLTADYATFCGREMTPFECCCGAAQCRRLVSGRDLLAPELGQRFGEHVSDYVRGIRCKGS